MTTEYRPEAFYDQDYNFEFSIIRRIVKEAKNILRQAMIDKLSTIIREELSEHQATIFSLYYGLGKTYQEIADMLGLNYTAVSHCIMGIKQKDQLFHGGVLKKIKKYIEKDKEAQKILAEFRYLNYQIELKQDDEIIEFCKMIEDKYGIEQ
jgi:predicted transcriptional regulator